MATDESEVTVIEPRVHPFTPIDEATGERVTFLPEEVEVLSGNPDQRRPGRLAVVKLRGVVYDVYGQDCGLEHCWCDASIRARP